MNVRIEWKRRYVLCYSTDPVKGSMISEINSGKRTRFTVRKRLVKC